MEKIEKLKELLESYGYTKWACVSLEKVKTMEEDLQILCNQVDLEKSQRGHIKSAIQGIKDFAKLPKKYSSILIVALPRGDGDARESGGLNVKSALKEAKFAAKPCLSLFVKRLAVMSGLAEYNRNNVTSVPSLGSWVQYTMFFTDAPFDDSNWREKPIMAPNCENCEICINACPKGAIKKDRFLFYREKCKGCNTECYWSCPLNVR